MSRAPVELSDIERARERIAEGVLRTPCAHSEIFSRLCGSDVFLKLENRHRTGSFKERGALNRILKLDDEQKRRGIITASAGNHAQALAYHAQRVGIPTTVVMPKQTPLVKVANTRGFGANVILEGDNFDDAYAHAETMCDQQRLTFVPPFEDPDVIAGQGTTGLELLEQLPDLDLLVVPIGGGGLISGIAVAYRALQPQVTIVGVQTELIPSMKRSLEEGARVSLEPAQTLADGIAVKRPGEITLELVTRYVDDIVTVGEEEIANAILLLLEREKMVAEGAAAVTLAALYNDRLPQARGRRVCLLISGGNIDVNVLSRIIERGLSKDDRVVRLDVKIADRPGALARLLNRVAEAEANVLEVHHQRAFDVGVGEVDVALKLETRGSEHVEELLRRLVEHGYEIRRRR